MLVMRNQKASQARATGRYEVGRGKLPFPSPCVFRRVRRPSLSVKAQGSSRKSRGGTPFTYMPCNALLMCLAKIIGCGVLYLDRACPLLSHFQQDCSHSLSRSPSQIGLNLCIAHSPASRNRLQHVIDNF